MPPTLRQAWTGLIAPADYEAHMAAVGQAQANAELVAGSLCEQPPPPGAAILFAGAGTGQMFDYLDPRVLAAYRTTFTDINDEYLSRLAGRIQDIPFETVVDDIEASGLTGPFNLAIVVLVLEHVDWRRAVKTLCRVASRVFVVIQEDPPGRSGRQLVGTMEVLREARPQLVPREELAHEFSHYGLRLCDVCAHEVPDEKRMVGLVFCS